jgi:transcription elongation factor GreA
MTAHFYSEGEGSMVEQPQYLTPEGFENLEKRLRHLVEVRRAEVAERLRQALEEGGDLSENAEYEDAKNEQAFIEGEILRLESILSTAQVIEASGSTDVVAIGSKVTVVEQGTKDKEVYFLVGSAEARPSEGKISHESPLGRALMGAKVGQKVTVKAPDGELIFTIKDIA